MNQIKFSHQYSKLLNYDGKPVEQLRLLWAFTHNVKTLPHQFLDYDTDGGKYGFAATGLYIVLVFEKERDGKCARNLVTTIRSFHKDKWQYYKASEGQLFRVVFLDKKTQGGQERGQLYKI